MSKSLAEEIAALFKEWREDYAAAQVRDACLKGMTAAEKEDFRKILEAEVEAMKPAEQTKDRGMER